MFRRTRALEYAALGAVLALGAPAGWLALRLVVGHTPVAAELAAHAPLYLYMTLGTLIAFVAFGVRLGHLADVVEAANQKLTSLSLTDSLTSLYNLRHFQTRLSEVAGQMERMQRPVSLLMMDLDHFKAVNDQYGHPVGDEVLVFVASILRREVRVEDVACRVGGEEFAVICPGADPEEAFSIAQRVRSALENAAVPTAAGPVLIRASLGVSTMDPGGSLTRLRLASDAALYTAKREGRNRVAYQAVAGTPAELETKPPQRSAN